MTAFSTPSPSQSTGSAAVSATAMESPESLHSLDVVQEALRQLWGHVAVMQCGLSLLRRPKPTTADLRSTHSRLTTLESAGLSSGAYHPEESAFTPTITTSLHGYRTGTFLWNSPQLGGLTPTSSKSKPSKGVVLGTQTELYTPAVSERGGETTQTEIQCTTKMPHPVLSSANVKEGNNAEEGFPQHSLSLFGRTTSSPKIFQGMEASANNEKVQQNNPSEPLKQQRFALNSPRLEATRQENRQSACNEDSHVPTVPSSSSPVMNSTLLQPSFPEKSAVTPTSAPRPLHPRPDCPLQQLYSSSLSPLRRHAIPHFCEISPPSAPAFQHKRSFLTMNSPNSATPRQSMDDFSFSSPPLLPASTNTESPPSTPFASGAASLRPRASLHLPNVCPTATNSVLSLTSHEISSELQKGSSAWSRQKNSQRPSFTEDPKLHTVVAYYFGKAQECLRHQMRVLRCAGCVTTPAERNEMATEASRLLCEVLRTWEQLEPLLPSDRLSDYLGGGRDEEAIDLTRHLLQLVEDVYLFFASESTKNLMEVKWESVNDLANEQHHRTIQMSELFHVSPDVLQTLQDLVYSCQMPYHSIPFKASDEIECMLSTLQFLSPSTELFALDILRLCFEDPRWQCHEWDGKTDAGKSGRTKCALRDCSCSEAAKASEIPSMHVEVPPPYPVTCKWDMPLPRTSEEGLAPDIPFVGAAEVPRERRGKETWTSAQKHMEMIPYVVVLMHPVQVFSIPGFQEQPPQLGSTLPHSGEVKLFLEEHQQRRNSHDSSDLMRNTSENFCYCVRSPRSTAACPLPLNLSVDDTTLWTRDSCSIASPHRDNRVSCNATNKGHSRGRSISLPLPARDSPKSLRVETARSSDNTLAAPSALSRVSQEFLKSTTTSPSTVSSSTNHMRHTFASRPAEVYLHRTHPSSATIESANTSAEWLLGLHPLDDLSRFSFFVPSTTAEQLRVHEEQVGTLPWYEEVASALEGHQRDAAVEWLHQHAALTEVSVCGGAGEDLLTAVQRCGRADQVGGIPCVIARLVVCDTTSGAVYGVDAYGFEFRCLMDKEVKVCMIKRMVLVFMEILVPSGLVFGGGQDVLVTYADDGVDRSGLTVLSRESSLKEVGRVMNGSLRQWPQLSECCSAEDTVVSIHLREKSCSSLKLEAVSTSPPRTTAAVELLSPRAVPYREERLSEKDGVSPASNPSTNAPGGEGFCPLGGLSSMRSSWISHTSVAPNESRSSSSGTIIAVHSQSSATWTHGGSLANAQPSEENPSPLFQGKKLSKSLFEPSFRSTSPTLQSPSTSTNSTPSRNSSLFERTIATANHVNNIKMTCLQHSVKIQKGVAEVLIQECLPPHIIVHDVLLLLIIQRYVEHSQEKRESAQFLVLLSQCDAHLVVDLVPLDRVPSTEEDRLKYHLDVQQYYRERQAQYQQLSSQPQTSFFFSGHPDPAVNPPSWLTVVSRTGQVAIPTEKEGTSPNVSLSSQLSRSQLGISKKSQGSSVSPTVPLTNLKEGDVTALSATCTAETPFPEVWAVRVGSEGPDEMGKALIHPRWYLTDQLREMLVATGAAVVATACGAATVAFPFITQEKLELLKEMRLVSHPLSTVDELGIVAVNQMAEEAMQMRTAEKEEVEKQTSSVHVSCHGAAALYKEAVEKSVHMAEDGLSPRLPGCMISGADKGHRICENRGGPDDSSVENFQLNASKPEYKLAFPPSSNETLSLNFPYSWTTTFGNNTEGQSADCSEDLPCSLSVTHAHAGDPDVVPLCKAAVYDTKPYEHFLGDPNVSALDLQTLPCNASLDSSKIIVGHTRIALFARPHCLEFYHLLLSLCHGVMLTHSSTEVFSVLQCGIDMYDLLMIEWCTEIMTPENLCLLDTQRKKHYYTPIFFVIVDNTITCNHIYPPTAPDRPLLPGDIDPSHLLIGSTFYDACLPHRQYVRSHIRLGRIIKDLRGNNTLNYQITRRIGSGGFGDVYEVIFHAWKGRLAMKRIPLGVITLERMDYLYKEVAIMRKLDHRNIVQLSHVNCDSMYLNIFMELCEVTLDFMMANRLMEQQAAIGVEPGSDHGPTPRTPSFFRQPLNNDSSREGPTGSFGSAGSGRYYSSESWRATLGLPRQVDASLVIRDVVSAVKYLHYFDIVHRDIKPQNILFLDGIAKLGDFGSATTASEEQSPLHAMKGTLPYMAPEVFLSESYRKSCDIWSLGILFAELLNLHLAHFSLLHFPALQEFYKSISPEECMPVVATNYVCSGFRKPAFQDTFITRVKETLQAASDVALKEREEMEEFKASILKSANTDARRRSHGLADWNPHATHSCGKGSTRTIYVIEVDTKNLSCSASQHQLPASLIELLESTFHRNPEKRITAEQLLEHPIVNDREWLQQMFEEMAKLNRSVGILGCDRGILEDEMMELSLCSTSGSAVVL